MFNKKYKFTSLRFACFVFIILSLFALSVFAENEVILGGFPFGLKMDTEGVFVSELSEFDSTLGRVCPAKDADIRAGDIILSANGVDTDTVEELSEIISSSGGKKVTLEIKRNGEALQKTLIPLLSSDKSSYKSGMWIKDEVAGIGTVTYLLDNGRDFGGLGHGICDRATLDLLPLKEGTVHETQIYSVVKGDKEKPGELKGNISEEASGTLLKNSDMGVFGKFNTPISSIEKITTASSVDVKTGPCTIYTCLDGNERKGYAGEIVKITDKNSKTKNFIVKITDKTALEKAGGIVQGMSGSPIVQNGKLVGAVTHVLMRDQTSGYGIFIENMLNESQFKADSHLFVKNIDNSLRINYNIVELIYKDE